jgi:protease-4
VWLVLSLIAVAVLISAGAVATMYLAVSRPVTVPRQSTLVVGLRGDLPEVAPGGLTGLLTDVPTLRDMIAAIRRAKTDSRVTGLLLTADSAPGFWGKTQELRDAVLDFKASGKPTVAYLDYGGDREYYLATACDQIYLLPTSGVALDGLASYDLFLRGSLDKLGVFPDLVHIGDYKTAINLFTEKGYTPAHREMTHSLNHDAFEQLVEAIAKARRKSPEEVRALIDEGPFLATEALELGLVDGLAYPDELTQKAKIKSDEDHSIDAATYRRNLAATGLGRNRIAVLNISGTITGGQGDGADGGGSTGSDTIARSLRRIRKDRAIKAVVVRIDSPGGSSIASDLIWRELELTKKEKPLVASMSDFAASGGYYVAMPASTIVAQPGTLTGSIGIYTGKFVWGAMAEKAGAAVDGVSEGRFAGMNSPVRPYTGEEREKVQEDIRAFYDNFVAKVAAARKLPKERVEELAQGRVWTGRQAKERGLVDELGGFDRALVVAKQLAKLDPEREVEIVTYPPRRGWYESITRPFGTTSQVRELVVGSVLTEEEVRTVRALSLRARLFRRGEPLALMPFVLQR